MIFSTKIDGVPCRCEVKIHHNKPGNSPKRIEFKIQDREGKEITWLAQRMTQEDDFRLRDEYQAACLAQRYGMEF